VFRLGRGIKLDKLAICRQQRTKGEDRGLENKMHKRGYKKRKYLQKVSGLPERRGSQERCHRKKKKTLGNENNFRGGVLKLAGKLFEITPPGG